MTGRIVVVDDHGLIAHTLAAALVATGATVAVLDPAAEDDLLAAVVAEGPTLVLLDLDLGAAGDGLDLLAPLRDRGVQVVVITGIDDELRLARCVAAGAEAVVSKDASFRELLATIDAVRRGEVVLSSSDRAHAAARLREHARATHRRLAAFESLSPREAEVLGELLRGRTVEEVARNAVVSVATVRSQVRAILRKLGVRSQVAAIARARDAGWKPPQEY